MKTITKVGIIAVLWIGIINTGQINLDTKLRLQMAHAWWTGTEEVSSNYQPSFRIDIEAGVMGTQGKRYIPYDLGQSILMLPGDWLGTQLHQWFPKLSLKTCRELTVSFLIFVPLNAAAVVACFWLLKLFEFNDYIAGLSSILWLLGTTVFHYAQIPQQNNQVLLFVTLGYATALAYIHSKKPFFIILSGLVLSISVFIRLSSIIHVFSVVLFFLGCLIYQSGDFRKVWQAGSAWFMGFLPLLVIERYLNYVRYGSWWITVQSLAQGNKIDDPRYAGLPKLPANYPLTNSPNIGILGVLFSPAKSIFLYDPLLLPCLGLGIIYWKRLSPYIQCYLITAILNLLLHIILTSKINFWHGDWAWGARYHVTSVHLLLIPLIPILIQLLFSLKGLQLYLVRILIACSIIIQFASVILPYGLEVAQDKIGQVGAEFPWDSRLEFRLGKRITNIACLIDSSISNNCINKDKQKSVTTYNLILIPFNYDKFGLNRKWTFIIWLTALTLAILTTVSLYIFQK